MNKRWIRIGLIGLLVSSAGLTVARAAEEKEENEQKVAFKDVPAAVRKTLEREANGQSITTVDKETQKGKVVYEADVKIDGHNYEIVVDEKGLLLQKKLDEEDEKSESKDKEGKK